MPQIDARIKPMYRPLTLSRQRGVPEFGPRSQRVRGDLGTYASEQSCPTSGLLHPEDQGKLGFYVPSIVCRDAHKGGFNGYFTGP
jgi:hypothetical protein